MKMEIGLTLKYDTFENCIDWPDFIKANSYSPNCQVICKNGKGRFNTLMLAAVCPFLEELLSSISPHIDGCLILPDIDWKDISNFLESLSEPKKSITITKSLATMFGINLDHFNKVPIKNVGNDELVENVETSQITINNEKQEDTIKRDKTCFAFKSIITGGKIKEEDVDSYVIHSDYLKSTNKGKDISPYNFEQDITAQHMDLIYEDAKDDQNKDIIKYISKSENTKINQDILENAFATVFDSDDNINSQSVEEQEIFSNKNVSRKRLSDNMQVPSSNNIDLLNRKKQKIALFLDQCKPKIKKHKTISTTSPSDPARMSAAICQRIITIGNTLQQIMTQIDKVKGVILMTETLLGKNIKIRHAGEIECSMIEVNGMEWYKFANELVCDRKEISITKNPRMALPASRNQQNQKFTERVENLEKRLCKAAEATNTFWFCGLFTKEGDVQKLIYINKGNDKVTIRPVENIIIEEFFSITLRKSKFQVENSLL